MALNLDRTIRLEQLQEQLAKLIVYLALHNQTLHPTLTRVGYSKTNQRKSKKSLRNPNSSQCLACYRPLWEQEIQVQNKQVHQMHHLVFLVVLTHLLTLVEEVYLAPISPINLLPTLQQLPSRVDYSVRVHLLKIRLSQLFKTVLHLGQHLEAHSKVQAQLPGCSRVQAQVMHSKATRTNQLNKKVWHRCASRNKSNRSAL